MTITFEDAKTEILKLAVDLASKGTEADKANPFADMRSANVKKLLISALIDEERDSELGLLLQSVRDCEAAAWRAVDAQTPENIDAMESANDMMLTQAQRIWDDFADEIAIYASQLEQH